MPSSLGGHWFYSLRYRLPRKPYNLHAVKLAARFKIACVLHLFATKPGEEDKTLLGVIQNILVNENVCEKTTNCKLDNDNGQA